MRQVSLDDLVLAAVFFFFWFRKITVSGCSRKFSFLFLLCRVLSSLFSDEFGHFLFLLWLGGFLAVRVSPLLFVFGSEIVVVALVFPSFKGDCCREETSRMAVFL